MEKTAEGRTITEREQELFLAWLAMYPAIMEIKAELEQKGALPHENWNTDTSAEDLASL